VDLVAVTAERTTWLLGAAVMSGWRGPSGKDLAAVTVEQTVWFSGTVMMTAVDTVGEVAAWYRRWRKSGMAQFPGAAVKVGRTAWFLGAMTVVEAVQVAAAWTQRRRRG
jgi:hypothetical protein